MAGDDKYIVLLATSWGSSNGGINVFNMSICSALATVLEDAKRKVACVVREATNDERSNAERNDVLLLVLDQRAKDQNLSPNRAAEVFDLVTGVIDGEVDWWIGHDVFSGALANELARKYNCSSAVIHHMNYEAYKSISRDEKILEKIKEQREILRAANTVFAVGPKLTNSAKDKTSTKSDGEVFEVVPGFEEISGVDEMPRLFRAITFGRLDRETDVIKLASLGVASFGHARAFENDHLGNDATITVFGISGDEREQLEERDALSRLASQHAGRRIPVNAFAYTEDRTELLDELRTFSVSMMLSVHEGFGLAGWEAIAAEVPLIITENSGLFELLERAGGAFLGCVKKVDIRGMNPDGSPNSDDVSSVAVALREIARKPASAKRDAQTLKGMLSAYYTWDAAAANIANALDIEVSADVNATTLSAKWQPERLIASLRRENDTVEQAARRHVLFDVLWRSLSGDKAIEKRILLFGGVASALCDDAAASRYAAWLLAGEDRHLMMAYETGAAASARAATLGKLNEELHGLPSEPARRMEEKARRVADLPARILDLCHGDNRSCVESRLTFVALTRPLSTYIMVFDTKITITPLFEQRSSDTLSFSLSDDSKPFLEDVLRFMKFHLQVAEDNEDKDRFLEELAILRNEVMLDA